MDRSTPQEYRTWSGAVRFTPRRHVEPANEEELVEIITTARDRGETVRPCASGASATPMGCS